MLACCSALVNIVHTLLLNYCYMPVETWSAALLLITSPTKQRYELVPSVLLSVASVIVSVLVSISPLIVVVILKGTPLLIDVDSIEVPPPFLICFHITSSLVMLVPFLSTTQVNTATPPVHNVTSIGCVVILAVYNKHTLTQLESHAIRQQVIIILLKQNIYVCTCKQSAYLWLVLVITTYFKNISDVKKGKHKLLNDLKVWNHCEAKKKRYTSKVV